MHSRVHTHTYRHRAAGASVAAAPIQLPAPQFFKPQRVQYVFTEPSSLPSNGFLSVKTCSPEPSELAAEITCSHRVWYFVPHKLNIRSLLKRARLCKCFMHFNKLCLMLNKMQNILYEYREVNTNFKRQGQIWCLCAIQVRMPQCG